MKNPRQFYKYYPVFAQDNPRAFVGEVYAYSETHALRVAKTKYGISHPIIGAAFR